MSDRVAMRLSGAVGALAVAVAATAGIGWDRAWWSLEFIGLYAVGAWGLLGVSVGAGLTVAGRRPWALAWVLPGLLVWVLAFAVAVWLLLAAESLTGIGIGGHGKGG